LLGGLGADRGVDMARATKCFAGRTVRLAGLGLALALVVASCGGGGDSTDSGGGASKGVIRYGYDFDAQFTGTFDISKSTGDCDQIVTTHIYDTLVHKDTKGNLKPGLLERWQIDPPGNKVQLWVRPGVKFSDGSPLDGQAVVNGLQTNAGNDQLTDLKKITKFTVDPKDPLHVTLDYADNTGINLPYDFTARDGMIMSTKSIADGTADTAPVGAGPFILTDYQKGSKISLRPNANYWDKDNTFKFGGFDFIKVGTGPPTVTAFQAGQLDFVRLETDGAKQLKGNPKYTVIEQPTGAYLQFEFRLKRKDGTETPFAKKEVRQAIEYGLDRERINQAAQDGLGELTDQPFPKTSPAHVDSLENTYKYDPDKAKQLLADGGYPNGFEFTMVIPGGGIANMEHQAVEVQQQLKQIGITAKIQRLLASEIATGYYIQGQGDAFVAAEQASTFPGGSLRNNFGIGEYVAVNDGAERKDITDLMNKAQSQTKIDDSISFVHQAVDIAVKEALDVPIAFMPQLNAYVTDKIHGTATAQTNICDIPDLSKVTVSG
jgi:peptide/nickel transport system substrate-binding protein